MSRLIVISAPSGAGKTSLVQAMVKRFDNLVASISHTTRKQRAGETNGTDYFFVDKPRFAEMVAAEEFLEHAEVFDYHYGTSVKQVELSRQSGNDVILEIDWQGARNVLMHFPDALTIFILPPSLETLRERLIGRGDEQSVIERRMAAAAAEMAHFGEYEYLVVNDDFARACEELAEIITQGHDQISNRRAKVMASFPELIASIKKF